MSYFSKKIDSWTVKHMPKGKTIELRNRQVFVLPTTAGFSFILLLLIILLVGINYQNNLAYGLCFILGSLFFLTIIHTCSNLSNLKIINRGAEPVFAGQMASCRLRLECLKGKTKQAIAVGWHNNSNDESHLQWIDVDHVSGVEILLTQIADRRGFFYPGKVYIETRFPLGLFVTWIKIDPFFEVIIYPKPVEDYLSTVGIAGKEEEGLQSFGRGVDDFQGLRSYQAGDSMRLVNWKSFSKGQGVFVKDFSALAGKEPWLDFEQISGSIEHRLSVLCFWALKMEKDLQPYGLRLPNCELSPSVGELHKKEVLNALAMYGIK